MNPLDQEIWKPIEGFDGMYEISSKGRLRSWKGVNQCAPKREKPIIRKQAKARGYNWVLLSNLNGKNKMGRIHRLVASTFLPNPEGKPEVNHKNGIKDDNRVENLEWVTREENMSHAWDIGLFPDQKGEGNRASKLTKQDVLTIKAILPTGWFTQTEIARAYEVDQGLISKINSGKSWGHL